MDDLIGQKLGRYQIIERLGEGGMATVYKGFDSTLHRNVAIKVIKSEMIGDASFRKRFEREARALAQLSHPHIVHINDYGEQGGSAYLVMDYLAGGTLKQKMGRPMPYQEAARLLVPVCQALGFAHQHKIVHRDVKPANILLTESGIPMLSDFGIAKMFEASSETIELTSSGMGVGTPAYMAPEQAGGKFDHRADIYSLGVVFYELVTGRRPYDADTPLATLLKHATDPLPAPRSFVPSLPDVVEQVIFKALAKNPNDRFQSMEEFSQQLELLQYGNLQQTFARLTPPDPATVIAQQGPATMAASQIPPGTYAAPHTPTPPPLMNMPQNAYPAYQQPAAQAPAYAPPKKSSGGKWVLGIILGILALGVLVVVGGGALYLLWPMDANDPALVSSTETANALSVQMTSVAGKMSTLTAQVEGTEFIAAESTRQVSEQVGAATQVVASATQQAASAATGAASEQLATSAASAALLELPRVAFFDKGDVWVVSLDGQSLVQLTTSGGDKRNLHWMPDGKSIYYITGKCVQRVDILTKEESKIGCFNFAKKVAGVEISNDGKYIGILADDNLYVGEYNAEKVAKLTTRTAMSDFATCGYYSGTRYFHFSVDSARVALSAIAPGEDVIRIHNQQCVSRNMVKLDEFPATRFRPTNFNDNPFIYQFGWDGAQFYAMTTNFRASSLGYMWFYNGESRAGEQTKPMGTDCCYYAPAYSADGSYLVFGYQDLMQPDTAPIHLYAVAVSDLGTGKKIDEIPLPSDMVRGVTAAPEPVIYIP